MTIENTLKQIANLRYEEKVDVVDEVMRQVAQRPFLQPVYSARKRWRITTIAAVVAVAIVTGVFLLRPHGYTTDEVDYAIMQFNDYSSWNTVESSANPFAYMYDEDEDTIAE